MMGRKSPLIWICIAITAMMLVLLVSCSQVSPSPSIQSSAVIGSAPTIEPSPVLAAITPSRTVASESPISSYKDLNRFISSDPSEIDNSGFPITPLEAIHITGGTQNVDIASYHLTIDGLVDNPLALSYAELLQFTSITKVVLLICPLTFVDNAEWTGVPVKTILTKAGLKPEASEVVFHSVDRYTKTLPLQDAQQDGVFLAYKVDGQTLPKEHGYPLRLVIEGKFGGGWTKWINQIEVK
jgi:DMSO/TMAO reductase YedYZ molybdopterin-dependent catalytic subunit